MKSENEIADEYEGTTSWISIAFLYISVAVRSATAGGSLILLIRSVRSGGLTTQVCLNLFPDYDVHFKLMLPSSRILEVDILRDANCVSQRLSQVKPGRS